MKVMAYSAKGNKIEDATLPKEFGAKVNLNLLAQAIHIYEERGHVGLRNTKTRSEVNRTTKKIYKQKGTGGARHGSRRANVFVGGGVVFGPRPLRRVLTLPTALKQKAKAMAFSVKSEAKELIVADVGKIAKTKEAAELTKKLSKETGKLRFTFVLAEKNRGLSRFLKNLTNAKVVSYREVNAFDIFYGGIIVLDEEIFTENNDNKDSKLDKATKPVKIAKTKRKSLVKKTVKKKVTK